MSTAGRLAALLAAALVVVSIAAGCGAGPAGTAAPGGTNGTPTTAGTPTTPPTSSTVSPTPPAATGQPPFAGATVRLERTGGFAGVRQVISIEPDGAWRFTDERAGNDQEGALTLAQRGQLAQLVNSADFARQMRQRPASSYVCNDAFTYVLAVGELQTSFEDCVTKDRPAVQAVVDYVVRATPM